MASDGERLDQITIEEQDSELDETTGDLNFYKVESGESEQDIESEQSDLASDLEDDEIEENQSDQEVQSDKVEEQSNKEDQSDNEENELDKESDDSDAPEEVNFSSTKKTAIRLAERQTNVLNRIKRQEQEKRKLNQERNIEQKKLKTISVQESASTDESDDESVKGIVRETETSKLKIILNDDDQIEKMNTELIKKYSETNNRMISFKDRQIMINPNIKRVDNSEARRMLHKRKVK